MLLLFVVKKAVQVNSGRLKFLMTVTIVSVLADVNIASGFQKSNTHRMDDQVED